MQNKRIYAMIKYVIILFFIFTIPFAFGLANESSEKLIVLNLAIDKENEQYTISMEYLIPQYDTSFSEKTGIISASALEISSAIEKLELQTGKTAGLSHTSAIILSGTVMQDNVFYVLDYFVREKSLGNNVILIGTPQNAKEFLSASSEPHNANINSLYSIVNFNNKTGMYAKSTIHSFMSDYNSPNKTSSIIILDLEEEKQKGDSAYPSSIDKQGDSEDENKEKPKKFIFNPNKTNIFYNGKYKTTLSNLANKGFALINAPIKKANINLQNITDEHFSNAEISVDLKKIKLTQKVSFNNSKPTIKYDINFKANINSIVDADNQKYFYKNNKNYISKKVQKALQDELNIYVLETFNEAKKYGIDIFKFDDLFTKYQYKNWQQYKENLENKNNYLENIEMFCNFKIIIN